MSQPCWDQPARSPQYSIVNKRETWDRFCEEPTKKRLLESAETWWANVIWGSVEYPVNERILGQGHTPREILGMIEEIERGNEAITEADIPGMGMTTLSELLEIMEPDSYATLNNKSTAGLRALGHHVVEEPTIESQYGEFVDLVKEAVGEYALRSRITEVGVGPVPADAAPVDIAQVAFELHDKETFAFDLATL